MADFLDLTGVNALWNRIKTYFAQTVTNYVVERGSANGWDYVKWNDGTIEGWYIGTVYSTSGNDWRMTVNTPITMANTSYQCYVQVPVWYVSRAYAGNRTTTTFQVATTATSSGTATLEIYMRGQYT